MKKLRLKFIQRMNVLLASIITFLGFSGCKQQQKIVETSNQQPELPIEEPIVMEKSEITDEPLVCKYGVPMAKHIIQGTVVDSNKKPLQNMRVVIEDTDGHQYLTTTDSVGHFALLESSMPTKSMSITVIDERGFYITEKQEIDLEYKGGDGMWDMGNANYQLNFVMQKAEPRLKKYGVPPVRKIEDNKVINDTIPQK